MRVDLCISRELVLKPKAQRLKYISSTSDFLPHFMPWARKRQEHFIVMSLSAGLEVLDVRAVTVGTLCEVLAHPREVFFPAILKNAHCIACAHNHPSGSLKPSPQDLKLAKILGNAGKVLRIRMVDFLIVTKDQGYYSFLEEGMPIKTVR